MQFQLRSLLLVFAAGGLLLAGLLQVWRLQERQHRLRVVRAGGGEVIFADPFLNVAGIYFLERHQAQLPVESVAYFDELRHLSFRGVSLADGELEPIARLKRLRLLDLTGTAISDRGLKPLVRQLPQLAALQLERTEVTGDWLLGRDQWPALEHLDLRRTPADDGTLALLPRCPNLKVLQLTGCTGITREGVLRLRRQLPACRIDWQAIDRQDIDRQDILP